MDFLKSLANYEKFSNYNYRKAHKLNRIKKLLSLLGNPQDKYFSVIIAGTKGKGSTASMLASVLSKSGLKAGLYTSPHLVDIRERIKIGNKGVSQKDFSRTISVIKNIARKNNIKGLTFFEAVTAACFLYFAQKRIDIAVLEVGLGGSLDAVNTADSKVCIITPISYDHTHLLGRTMAKIAREKSGVIKKDCYVICAPQAKEAHREIEKKASAKNAKLFYVGRNIKYKNIRVSLRGTIFDIETKDRYYSNLSTPLIGAHQAQNAAAVLGAIGILRRYFNLRITDSNIREGLKAVDLKGRFLVVSRDPYLVLDGAQNKASAEALRDTYFRVFGKKRPCLVLGISSDKDITSIGKILCPLAELVIFTKADSSRAALPQELAEKIGRFCKRFYITHDASDAVLFAKEIAGRDSVVLAAGSLFLVGDILKRIKD